MDDEEENTDNKILLVKMLHMYRQTDRHTDPLTKWVVCLLSLLKIQIYKQSRHTFSLIAALITIENSYMVEKRAIRKKTFTLILRNGSRNIFNYYY